MTLAVNRNPDGSVQLTDNTGVSIQAQHYDLLAILQAFAHSDAQHMVGEMQVVLLHGRDFFTDLWLAAAAAKSMADAQAINKPTDKAEAAAVVQALQMEVQTKMPQAIKTAESVLGPANPAKPVVAAPDASPADAPSA